MQLEPIAWSPLHSLAQTLEVIAEAGRDKLDQVGPASDQYSLGCVLYYCLTGKVPFQAKSLAQILLMHQMDDPPGLDEERAEVPLAVEAMKLSGRCYRTRP